MELNLADLDDYWDRANDLYNQRQYASAETDYRKVTELNPDYGDA